MTLQLGLGSSCVRVVPCNSVVGSPLAMDVAALDRMMVEDSAAQKKPLLVIANAGSAHDAWLHVEGHALAALTLPNTPNLPAKIGDSMTLPLSLWLGIPSLPYVVSFFGLIVAMLGCVLCCGMKSSKGEDILNATVEQRKTFTSLVSSATNLQLVEIPGWAGLGEGSDGLNCVRFGMVTADTDLSDLLSLVITTGKEIEKSSRFLDQMTDIVRKGIEAATEDLKRENEERLWQEGILRHVPIVGSVYNWFSPPPPPGIKGRTLDLTAGVLESTENIYRYHMQVSQHNTLYLSLFLSLSQHSTTHASLPNLT
ncbi:Pyridoxal-dependent decarboxylase domain-containing protein 1 [Portunus trituberculatus]|uniref:Pyridoxal-dependent decarboxylase domain-containing protein 1 n=1 Tax=Portunus trituberculatus TaxID=210409 RepID=A0A5B7DRC8_PORTR|nr:Pyridoxal-dependent decarboxylase domain-containing protein 1 [Portunus trituberculatus]